MHVGKGLPGRTVRIVSHQRGQNDVVAGSLLGFISKGGVLSCLVICIFPCELLVYVFCPFSFYF